MSENQSENQPRQVALQGHGQRALAQWVKDAGADVAAWSGGPAVPPDPFGEVLSRMSGVVEPPPATTVAGTIRQSLRRSPVEEPQAAFTVDVGSLTAEQFAELQAAVDERSDRELAEAAQRLGLTFEEVEGDE